jgi:hypothetical protein
MNSELTSNAHYVTLLSRVKADVLRNRDSGFPAEKEKTDALRTDFSRLFEILKLGTVNLSRIRTLRRLRAFALNAGEPQCEPKPAHQNKKNAK